MVFYTLPNKEAAPILTQPHKQYKNDLQVWSGDLFTAAKVTEDVLKCVGSGNVADDVSEMVVCCDIAMVVVTNVRVHQRLDVIAYCQHQLVCNETFAHKVESNGIRHLLDKDPCFLECVGL